MQNNRTTISILGCGWYGLALAKVLLANDYHVKGSTTTPEKIILLQNEGIQPYLMNFENSSEKSNDNFFDTDLLFICIPPKRSSGEQASFPVKIEKIANMAANNKVKDIVFISSTSVYGDHNKNITEIDQPQPDTASGLSVLAAENLLLKNKLFTTTIIRFAGLVGPGRDPGRFFAGKQNVPNGLAPVNLIHLNDCIQMSLQIVQKKAFGQIYNACCPDHPTKQEFYTKAASRSSLPLPSFLNEIKTWKIIG